MINRFVGRYRWLSNFVGQVVINGIGWSTLEHAYQAAKTLDVQKALEIYHAPTAGEAKRLGGQVELRPDWLDVRDGIMMDLLRAKFKNQFYREDLVATYPQELIEGNHWHDVYWGVCYCSKHNGMGENKLGKFLMELRDEFIGQNANLPNN